MAPSAAVYQCVYQKVALLEERRDEVVADEEDLLKGLGKRLQWPLDAVSYKRRSTGVSAKTSMCGRVPCSSALPISFLAHPDL